MVSMALAARRSELVALDVADLVWDEQGLRVTIRRSKTDQEGAGAGSPRCCTCAPGSRPPASPKARCSGRCGRAEDGQGPQGRAGAAVPGCATPGCPATPSPASCRRALAAGLDPARFAGHSLRAGFVTAAAARAGADLWKIQQVSRHKSLQVLSSTVRDARLFDNHAGEPSL